MDRAAGEDDRATSDYPPGGSGLPPEPEWSDPLAALAVLGLSEPRLSGRMVRSRFGTSMDVTLEFGDAVDSSALPFVMVRTCPSVRRAGSRAARLDLALLTGQRRLRRLPEHPAPPEDIRPSSPVQHRTLLVAGIPVPGIYRSLEGLWAFEAHLSAQVLPPGPNSPGTLVTVVARGVDPAQVQLDPVNDLEPFRAAAHRARTTASGLKPASAADASYKALEELVLAALRGGPDPDRYDELSEWMIELRGFWSAAHRAQMHFAGQDAAAAAAALNRLTEQMRTLSREVRWWDDDGSDAVAESIRYTVFGSPVASRAAQEQWERGIADPTARERWLQAWHHWHSLRGRPRRPAEVPGR